MHMEAMALVKDELDRILFLGMSSQLLNRRLRKDRVRADQFSTSLTTNEKYGHKRSEASKECPYRSLCRLSLE